VKACILVVLQPEKKFESLCLMWGKEKHLLIIPGQEFQGHLEGIDLCGLILRRSEGCLGSCPYSQARYCHPPDLRHSNFSVKGHIF